MCAHSPLPLVPPGGHGTVATAKGTALCVQRVCPPSGGVVASFIPPCSSCCCCCCRAAPTDNLLLLLLLLGSLQESASPSTSPMGPHRTPPSSIPRKMQLLSADLPRGLRSNAGSPSAAGSTRLMPRISTASAALARPQTSSAIHWKGPTPTCRRPELSAAAASCCGPAVSCCEHAVEALSCCCEAAVAASYGPQEDEMRCCLARLGECCLNVHGIPRKCCFVSCRTGALFLHWFRSCAASGAWRVHCACLLLLQVVWC